ncbi:lipocalin family protein [Niabella sp. W65]|nr:lipocalin family protein [Niabella sp. W65]MCH7363834.1 lipocalin family protein [Niabella sp. W65]
MAAGRTVPKGIKAVSNFQKDRYLGKWYEIARFDFRFEKNMSRVTAEYSANSDGTIRVKNSGYDNKKYKQKQSIGKAKFVGNEDVAMLKVSFFGPFYAGYNVIAIDDNYQYALVCGKSRDYLWLLSRKKQCLTALRTTTSTLQKGRIQYFRTRVDTTVLKYVADQSRSI